MAQIKSITGNTTDIRKDKYLVAYFRAQVPIFGDNHSLVRNVKINFSLPIEEILSEISAIKKRYNEYYTEPSLPITGEELQKFKNRRVNFSSKKKQLEGIIYPKKTILQLYADIFFIYDIGVQYDITDSSVIRYIKNELEEYYAELIVKINDNSNMEYKTRYQLYKKISESITSIDKSTIQEYYNLLEPFIEKLGYKRIINSLS